MSRILVTCAQMRESLQDLQSEIAELGWQIHAPELVGQQFSEDELIDLLQGVDGVIAGDDPFKSRVLRSAPDLKAISKWGVGVDGIDIETANQLGIAVTRTPDMFGDEVADVAIGYLINLARGLVDIHNSVKSGGWLKPNGYTLRGKRATVIGLGNIGSAITVRLLALGMEVVAVDPGPSASESAKLLSIALTDLDTAVRGSHALITACPLNEQTRGAVRSDVFSLMGTPAWLVHVSRGPVVNASDLVSALESGLLDGAALDVYPNEPLPPDDPIRTAPNVLFGSHNGSHTYEATRRTSQQALRNLAECLESR